MKDQDKSKEHLINELTELRQRVTELEASETERKRVGEALRESEARYRAVVEDQTELIGRSLPDGRLTFVNEAFCRYFNKSREELIGRSFMVLIPEKDREIVEKTLAALSPDNPVGTAQHRVILDSGEIRWQQWTDRVIFDQAGNPVGFQAVGRDITDRKQAEEALRRRAEELAALQATVLDITAPHDLPALLHIIVERAARLLNTLGGGMYLCDQDREEVRCVVSYNTPSDYTGTVLKYGEGAVGTVAQTGEPLIIDDYRIWPGRAVAYEEEQPFTAVLCTPMIWMGQVTGVINVIDDVERRRFTEADLELLTLLANHAAIAVENGRLYEQARQDAETKAALLHEVNHRVRNNLTAIIGLLDLERNRTGVDNQASYRVIMEDLTNRVQGLATVHRLLSKAEWAPLLLSELAEQVIGSALQALPLGKHVAVEVPPSPVRVSPKDANNLALMINELATNSVKYAWPARQTGHIAVRIEQKGDMVLFEFRDDGVGYPEEVLCLERHSVGWDLIQGIVGRGLRGEVSLHNDQGAVTTVRFPAPV